jgi:glycerol-3-phosphate acyltransferase PlsY
MTPRLICLAVGYIFGLFQTGQPVGKAMHTDISKEGSGNVGTTNALRVLGAKAGALVMLGDVGKAFLCCTCIRLYFTNRAPEWMYLYMLYGGLGVTLGHNFPIQYHGKGGKGIAVTGGIILAFLDWRIFLLCLAAFLVPILVTRYVSLGSLIAETVLWICWYLLAGKWLTPVLCQAAWQEGCLVLAVIVVLAFIRHRANIGRLLHGNENKIHLHKKGTSHG